MSENTTEVLVGAAVLCVAGFFLFFAGQTTGFGQGSGGSYELKASFRSAEGVSLGTDVRLAGVKVGTVTGLELNPQTFKADVIFSVDQNIEIPDDSAVVVSSEGLLGGSFVELMPGGSLFNVEPGAELEDTQGAVSLISLLLKFASGGGE
jgi:phospholipid/cholesterol/gamma-HCH transport system substrate-binding protein